MFLSLSLLACVLSPGNHSLLEAALTGWSRVMSEDLQLRSAPPPLILVADRRCLYTLRPSSSGLFRLGPDHLDIIGREHLDTLALPNGAVLPLRGMAFTSLFANGDSVFFFASMLDVWAADPTYAGDTDDWNDFLVPVLVHELTHTRQIKAIVKAIEPAATSLLLTSVDDDMIQKRFEGDATFAAAMKSEIDMLLAAATERPRVEQVDLVRAALARRAERHRTYFPGADSGYVVLETRFLDMEGVAQWAAFRYRRRFHGAAESVEASMNRVRDNRRWWSQEYGFALYLALDALVPGWHSMVFPPTLTSAFTLLTLATCPPGECRDPG